MNDSESYGEPHTLVVHSVTNLSARFGDVELDYDLEHSPSCKQEERYDGHVLVYTCAVANHVLEVGLENALNDSGTPVTEPGTYRIQAWDRKYRVWDSIDGYEYDAGVGVMDPGAAA